MCSHYVDNKLISFLFSKKMKAYDIGLGIPAETLFRYTEKDISNVVTDAAYGVGDIFHGIDKAFFFQAEDGIRDSP